jgi:8-oxo-dGTP pyrophosphatase MutT (NUDIX family)
MDLIKHAVKLKATDVRPRVLMYLYDDQGRVLASQAQEGHDSDQKNWKFPGGGIESGQSINEAARREALEEAGYQALTTHGVGSRPKLTKWPEHFREKAKKKKGRDFKAQRTYFRAGKIGDQQRDLLGADNDALKGLDMVPIATLIKDLETSSSDSGNPYAVFDVAKLKGLRALKERLEKTSSLATQEEIYKALQGKIPTGTHHVSGGLADARGISDVDIYLPTEEHSDLLTRMPEGTTVSASSPTKTVYTIPGYGREVNLYATMDPRKEESIRHRATMVALAEKYPELTRRAFDLKAGGLKSEPAWAKVLGLKGDPFLAMEDTKGVLEVANRVAQQRTKTSSAVELATLTLDSAFVEHMQSKLAEEESTSRALKAIPMDPPLLSSKSLLKELSHLSNMMSKPTLSLEFAEEVDRDLTSPFRRLLETIGKADEADPVINKLVRISTPVILKLKESFGRLRPEDQAAELGVPFTAVNSEGQMYSGTGEKTPSYPSGHSMQSKLLSLALGQMYPEIKDMLEELAAAIGKSRLEMGVHFPSDHEYGCRAAEALFDHMDEMGSEKTSGVKKKYQDPKGGLNRKGRAHFKRTEGANLKRPVSKKQAKKSPKSAKRRKSFCARMGGMKKKHNIDCSKTPDKSICKALRKWDC